MGRLIDADALIDKYGDWYTEEGTEEGYIGTIKGIVDSMPTIEPQLDEWCETCKEYDQQNHSCPRFNRVIRETLDDVRKDAMAQQWIPFSEQSPKDGQKILACSDDGIMWMTAYSPQSRLSGAWQSLPEPWKDMRGDEE